MFSEDGECPVFEPKINILEANFETRVRLYLKPKTANVYIQAMLLVLDTVFA